MGRARDNRFKQNRGTLLNLTKRDSEARDEWQKSRPLDWTDTMILTPRQKAVMSWDACASLDLEKLERLPPNASLVEMAECFTYHKAGKKTIDIRAPSWYTPFRTDKTDAIRRQARQARRKEEY